MGPKNKKNKGESTKPMPSLIFHEGSLDNTETPNADQIEKELLTPPRLPNLDHLKSYKKSSRQLMWFAVITLALVISGMWGWSIYFQITSIKWSKTSESNLVSTMKDSWRKTFYDDSGKILQSDDQVELIKQNLNKLFSGAAANASPTTTATSTAPTTTP